MRLRGLVPALLCLSAGSGWAAPPAFGVDISFVAPEASDYQQTEAHFTLDGRPLAVPDDSSPGQQYLLFAGDLPPGEHRLEVDLQYRRSAGFFTRGSHAVVQVKGSADFRVDPGRHVSVIGRIEQRPDPERHSELPSFVAGISVSGAPPPAPAPPPDSPPLVSHAAPPPPVPAHPVTAHPPPAAEAKKTPAAKSEATASAARPASPPVPVAKSGAAKPAVKKKAGHPQETALTALQRLRERMRLASAKGHPASAKKPAPAKLVKPKKASAPKSEDAAVARLRALLRKSVKGKTAQR